jgi:hypothetical protein
MADSENTLPVPAGKPDLGDDERIELRTVIFEMGITLEAVSVGLEAVHKSPAAVLVRNEIEVLRRHFRQALEFFDKAVAIIDKPKAG